MPLITTIGGAESNSYVTVQEADVIASQYPWFDDWNQCGDKEANLIAAAKALNSLPWEGDKCYPASDAGRKPITWGEYPNPAEVITDPQAPFYEVNRSTAASDGLTLTWGKTDGSTMVTSTRDVFIGCKNYTTGEIFAPSDLNNPVATASNGLQDNLTFNYAGPIAYIKLTYDPSVFTGKASFNRIAIDGESLTNVTALSNQAPQALAWPRHNVECEGETATCDYIPAVIKETQVLIAYNFCNNPSLIPGAPGSGDSAPTGTYTKRQKLGDLEIEYAQFTNNAFNDECNTCDDPYLIQTFPWLADMLGCWLGAQTTGKGRIIGRVRS